MIVMGVNMQIVVVIFVYIFIKSRAGMSWNKSPVWNRGKYSALAQLVRVPGCRRWWVVGSSPACTAKYRGIISGRDV